MKNPATTPALEAACRAARRHLRLTTLRLHGNGFGSASKRAVLDATAGGPLAGKLQLSDTLQGAVVDAEVR